VDKSQTAQKFVVNAAAMSSSVREVLGRVELIVSHCAFIDDESSSIHPSVRVPSILLIASPVCGRSSFAAAQLVPDLETLISK